VGARLHLWGHAVARTGCLPHGGGMRAPMPHASRRPASGVRTGLRCVKTFMDQRVCPCSVLMNGRPPMQVRVPATAITAQPTGLGWLGSPRVPPPGSHQATTGASKPWAGWDLCIKPAKVTCPHTLPRATSPDSPSPHRSLSRLANTSFTWQRGVTKRYI
jgi:hypothetical protein